MPEAQNQVLTADDYAAAVRIVWRLINDEAKISSPSIKVRLDLVKLMKQDKSLKLRLLQGIESATGSVFLDGLWENRYFTMADLIDFCAESVYNQRRSNKTAQRMESSRSDPGPDRDRDSVTAGASRPGLVNIRIESVEELTLRHGKRLTVATLDVPYYSFIGLDAQIHRPSCKSHHEILQLRVRLTRPDGTSIEPLASIPLVGGHNPLAKLSIDDVRLEDAPTGTEVILIRYEVQPRRV